jgi:hypothetical protein
MRNVHLITKEQEGADVLHQYLYITSEEEIGEGDWYLIEFNGLKITQCNSVEELISIEGRDDCKKIILTTDPDLIGVQPIDNEFLEWFVKNPSCERAEVVKGKMQLNDDGQEYGFPDMSLYKIIIPQGEPKQETLEEAAENMRKKWLNGNINITNIFIEGANWEAERIPSIIEEYLETAFISKEQGYMNPQKWFEQFKKK